jgi:hypothetical protein
VGGLFLLDQRSIPNQKTKCPARRRGFFRCPSGAAQFVLDLFLHMVYTRGALLGQRRRRSRQLRRSKARPPTTRAAMERREAPGLLARARAPRDPHRPQATCALPAHWVPEAWRAGRPIARLALREPIARLPGRLLALHSSPIGRGTENRKTGAPGRPKNKIPGQRSVGFWVLRTTQPVSFRGAPKGANPE